MSAVPPDPAGDQFVQLPWWPSANGGRRSGGGCGFWDDPIEAPAPRKHVPWARLLKGRSPAQLIPVVGAGDPFGLKLRTSKRINAQAIFLDSEHLFMRSIARVAYECAGLARRPRADRIQGWLLRLIDRSISELCNEDNESLRRGHLSYETDDPRYLFMTETLGLPGRTSRARCVAFNGLDITVRRAFHAIAISGATVSQATEKLNAPAHVLQERVLLASHVLAGTKPEGRDPFSGARF